MVCKKCGHQNSGTSKYCTQCGRRLSEESNNKITIILAVALVVTVVALVLVLFSPEPKPPVYTEPRLEVSTGQQKPQETAAHIHSWKAANCTAPETCLECGTTRGSALDHQWLDATYDSPKTCYLCGTMQGDPLNPLAGQSVDVGDTVYFGWYGDGTIEWRVIDEKGNKRLLISEYGLDCVEYDNQDSSDFSPDEINWKNCSLREWLNEVFYYEAFDSQEASIIVSVAEDGISDEVFILSEDQLQEYFPSKKSRICTPTYYSVERGSYNDNGGWWWLRTNEKTSRVSSVNADGSIDHNTRVNGQKSTVRVCIWVDIT